MERINRLNMQLYQYMSYELISLKNNGLEYSNNLNSILELLIDSKQHDSVAELSLKLVYLERIEGLNSTSHVSYYVFKYYILASKISFQSVLIGYLMTLFIFRGIFGVQHSSIQLQKQHSRAYLRAKYDVYMCIRVQELRSAKIIIIVRLYEHRVYVQRCNRFYINIYISHNTPGVTTLVK